MPHLAKPAHALQREGGEADISMHFLFLILITSFAILKSPGEGGGGPDLERGSRAKF